jgi:hypothetical protein
MESLGRTGYTDSLRANQHHRPALADPHVQARRLIVRMGNRDFIGSPIRMSKTPPTLRRGPAEIGEHSREVLMEAGFSAAEVQDLLASGALLQRARELNRLTPGWIDWCPRPLGPPVGRPQSTADAGDRVSLKGEVGQGEGGGSPVRRDRAGWHRHEGS